MKLLPQPPMSTGMSIRERFHLAETYASAANIGDRFTDDDIRVIQLTKMSSALRWALRERGLDLRCGLLGYYVVHAVFEEFGYNPTRSHDDCICLWCQKEKEGEQ